MEDKSINQNNSLSVLCWNIANPSVQRAGKQAEWLRKRPENVLVLTETKQSEGCSLLERYFQAYGYNVISQKPEAREYGVMIVSKLPMKPSFFATHMRYLPSRLASAKVSFSNDELEIIGVYVPSRDTSYEKIDRKKRFLEHLNTVFNTNSSSNGTVFCGDLNILEPDHIPHYPFFEEWEYDFYCSLTKHKLIDAFRHLNPEGKEYSWVGRTGDGYRYDHCFVSSHLLPFLRKTSYLHEPRKLRLSDHSALITVLEGI